MMTIVILALSFTVCEIFKVEICMTLTCTLQWVNIKCKYASGKAVCDFQFIGEKQCLPHL